MTIVGAKRFVRKLGYKPGESGYDTALLLISLAVVGPSKKKVRKFTGLPWGVIHGKFRDLVRRGLRRTKYARKIQADWCSEAGAYAFILDCCVMEGLMKRVG